MSQLNFFLSREETLNIVNAFIKANDVLVFTQWHFKDEYPIAISDIAEAKEADNFVIWLKNEFCEPKGKIITEGVSNGKFTFDYYRDPIIEFSDCKRTKTLISPGRIFYKAGWIENDELRNRHVKWCSKTSRQINKKLKRINEPWRISDEIENWVINGGNLELGQGGKIINKNNLIISR